MKTQIKHALFDSLSTLPDFAVYLGLALALTALFLFIYTLITPYKEIALIREGKVAPAISLGGSLLGFVLPLAAAIRESVDPLDLLVWGAIGLAVQLFAFLCVRLVIPGLIRGIKEDKVGYGLFLGLVSVALGLLNAACMSW